MSISELTGVPCLAWVGACVVGLLTVFYVYLTWHFNYWQSQGVKSKKPKPLWGTMGNPFKIPQDVQDMEHYKKFGRVYGIYEGRMPSLHVADPDLLKQILVKDFHMFPDRRDFVMSDKDIVFKHVISTMKGDEWKHHRSVMSPTFTTGKMKQMLLLIEDCAKELMIHLRQFSEKKEPVDFVQCMSAYSLDVIATCAFGTKIDCLNNPDNEFVKHANAAFNSPPKLLFLAFIFPKLGRLLPPFMPLSTQHFFSKLVDNVIHAREKETNPRKDFLQIMLEEKADCESGTNLKHENSTKYPITQNHIMANSVLFIVAGFETTSTALSFGTYQIACNEDVQERLIKEIDDVLEEKNGKFDYEIIGSLVYLEMVISEVLRMYPPAVRLERECADDYELNGIKLTKGMVIGIPIYCIHNDEEFFPEPEKFDPERFSSENKTDRNQYTYMPFGLGPRSCIGMRFAIMEIKIVLAYLLKEFRLKIGPTTDIPYVRKKKSAFLKPERINLYLEKRTDCVQFQ